ncbi:hypothetical protein NHF48_019680 [Sphingomonas sp. H160509]|uniref:hypothetical protein n=1 Tax=Sphingomonas sp. H160509 TaxID=2955313 RepID=UPI002097B75A|nr:hypothetical protein [Sphingomonas sp. H160509]MDD1452639.1 hypothetical protein [Sphingomonas sp. H160509]
MTAFHFPARYDEAQADEGVWTSVIDEVGNHYGRFKLCLFDELTPRYRVTLERLQRKYPAKNGRTNEAYAAKSDDEKNVEVFVELSLVDWEIKDEKGKAIPFAKDTAIAYLSDVRALYVLRELAAFARDVRNFQPEEQTDLPEGN